MGIFNIGRTYAEIARMWAVIRVFVELIIDEFINGLYRPVGLARRPIMRRVFAGFIRRLFRRDRKREPFPIAFRKSLERLGPTYVKFGQILSLREDFLPARMTNELRKLQNQVPAIPFHKVKKVVEGEFKLPLNLVFKDFSEKPLAAASLAQTHLATLKNSQKVVVKVQRPGIARVIESDINIMRRLATLAERIPMIKEYSPRNIVDEFATYTMRELDFTIEGKNADKFRENFKDYPDVIFPKIYWDYTSRRVLTMEFIQGVVPDSRAKLKKLKIDTEKVSLTGINAILKMLYQDGFFHGDPHPGNIFIVGGRKVAFIDLGMTGSFSKEVKRNMFLYYYNMVIGEYDHATRYLLGLCTTGAKSDEAGFRRELAEKINKWSSSGFQEYSLGQLILQSMNIGAKYQVYFHRDLVLMSKALVTIESVGYSLEPDLDYNKAAEPFMQKLFLEQFSPVTLGKQFLNAVPDYMRLVESLPTTGVELFQAFQQGVVRVKMSEEDRELAENRFEINKTAGKARNYSIITGATLLGGSILLSQGVAPGGYLYFIRGLEEMPVMAGILFASSVFFGLLTLLESRRRPT